MSGSISPVPWTGSKGCIYTTIDAFMPPHKTYIEPCMGSAEVFLRKKPCEKEILNDYNGDLVNFFRVLQGNANLVELLGRLYLSYNSEELFRANKAMLESVPNILDDANETNFRIDKATPEEMARAIAFIENQTFSFSSTGKTFAIAKNDMSKRLGRFVAANHRLKDAIILHRDYKDAIEYAAGPDTFILLDPPYKGTEKYYKKSNFDSKEHEVLFEFMSDVDKRFDGECKFLITYNDCPFIRNLAEEYGFNTFRQDRIHNMIQGVNPGEMFHELLIGNYDLEAQAEKNREDVIDASRQMSLFEFKYDY